MSKFITKIPVIRKREALRLFIPYMIKISCVESITWILIWIYSPVWNLITWIKWNYYGFSWKKISCVEALHEWMNSNKTFSTVINRKPHGFSWKEPPVLNWLHEWKYLWIRHLYEISCVDPHYMNTYYEVYH